MSVLVTDDFNRTSGADLGANWTPAPSEGAFEIFGNAALVTVTGSDSTEYNTDVTWPNDQWSESLLGTVLTGGVGVGCGASCRISTSARTFYRFVTNGSGWELGKMVAGSFTSLGSGSGTTWTTGDTSYISAQGTSIIAKKGSAAGAGGTTISSQTDSAIASGNAGIGYSSAEASQPSINSWQGGDFAGGAAAKPKMNQMSTMGMA